MRRSQYRGHGSAGRATLFQRRQVLLYTNRPTVFFFFFCFCFFADLAKGSQDCLAAFLFNTPDKQSASAFCAQKTRTTIRKGQIRRRKKEPTVSLSLSCSMWTHPPRERTLGAQIIWALYANDIIEYAESYDVAPILLRVEKYISKQICRMFPALLVQKKEMLL